MASAATQPTPPELLQKPNEEHPIWLLRRIWDRVNLKNQHFMGCIVGEEGSGKSWTAVRIASEVDPTFSADRVIFDVVELLKILRDGKHEPGHFYVLDEAGVQLGRRTWQERGQVLANQALQIIRDHNLGLVFTLPRLSELDSQTQGRLQAFYELTEKEDGEYVRGKWKWMDPDRADETGKIYKKFPRRRVDGVILRITDIAFKPPGRDLIDPYKKRKEEFQADFYDKTIEELSDEEEDEEEEPGPKEIATEIAANGLKNYISEDKRNGDPYINGNLIRAHYEMSHSDARTVKALLDQQFSTEDLEVYV